MNNAHNQYSRREFLRRTAGLSALGVAGPTALNMSALSRVAAASATDYKALVCVFLYGANDHYNTFVPYDTNNYDVYAQARQDIATNKNSLASTVMMPRTEIADGKQFAMAAQFSDLHQRWEQQQLGVLLNVGPLAQPTSKLEYQQRSVPIPPKIFSHNDQQSIWQSLSAEGSTSGWGGRMADLFLSSNIQDLFTGVSVTGDSVFLSGEASVQYQIGPGGSIDLAPAQSSAYGSELVSSAITQLMTAGQSHLIKRSHADIAARSLQANDILRTALTDAPVLNTEFNGGKLNAQLQMVARMISIREALGMKRQVFFVGLGGFDNHNDLNEKHPPLLTEINSALNNFYTATEEMQIANKITTFTASDFGRTLNSNGDGSDHGWGSHHMIMGGAVGGGDFYGVAPELGDNGPDDVGRGRLLPTTSVEQMAATLGEWFGCSSSELNDILPAISKFNTRNLEFMSV